MDSGLFDKVMDSLHTELSSSNFHCVGYVPKCRLVFSLASGTLLRKWAGGSEAAHYPITAPYSLRPVNNDSLMSRVTMMLTGSRNLTKENDAKTIPSTKVTLAHVMIQEFENYNYFAVLNINDTICTLQSLIPSNKMIIGSRDLSPVCGNPISSTSYPVRRDWQVMTDITVEFLQKLLKDEYPDVTIQEFVGAPGSKRGDNYTSMVYRISLKGIQKHIEPDGSSENDLPWECSIIYKCLPESTLRREAFKSDELFCNEVAFYNKIWPALLKFQSQWSTVKSPFKSIPKCYLAQNDLVILRDLKQLGFTMPDRRQGLSTEQCYFVLKNLSQFHALSLAMKYYDPEGFYELINIQDGISEVFFVEENKDYYKSYYRIAARNAIAMVEEELRETEDKDVYLKKFQDFCSEDSFFQTMVELVTPKEPLAVICHGDCWTNNLLFKYVDGDIAEMNIVDFQLVRYASPALDLVYLMYMCLDRQQRSEHLQSLLEYYADELHKRLVELSDEDSVFNDSLNRDTLYEMLQCEFKRSSRFGLGIALDMYPIMTCDSDEAPNLYQSKESELASPECFKPVWTSNETCRRKMTDLVQELIDGGLL